MRDWRGEGERGSAEGGTAEVEKGIREGNRQGVHFPRPKDAVAAIRKRLTGNTKNFHIINLTLTVSCCQFDRRKIVYNAFNLGVGDLCQKLWH